LVIVLSSTACGIDSILVLRQPEDVFQHANFTIKLQQFAQNIQQLQARIISCASNESLAISYKRDRTIQNVYPGEISKSSFKQLGFQIYGINM